MRSPCVVFAALLILSIFGCTTDGPGRSAAWFKSLSGFRGPTGADVVQVEWALIQRPVGDRYLNEGLWALANEQIVPLERKEVLENNGLRVGAVSGLLPSEFQELLRSERYNPNPRRRHVRAGQAATLLLGSVRAQCDCDPPSVPANIQGESLHAMFDAQFGIAVTPSLASGNKVRLALTPQVQQGEAKAAIKPAEDGSGWSHSQQAPEKYSGLNWDVTLAPDEYLLVGCHFANQRTFGKECFVRTDEPRPVQLLLVVRAVRQFPETAAAEIVAENVPPRTAAAVAQVNAGASPKP